ncbi:MAG: 16S rRNA (guanine(966)-N(2))-methyltransferase RsmD [Bacteroidales bacterium]
MRIIAGQYKGRYFSPDKYFKARPTTDHAREGLFNILTNRCCFNNVSVLDLFAGTGAISFEFISRGVANVVAVESDNKHVGGIKKVATELGISEELQIVRADVFKYLAKCNSKYDVIFADPPYNIKNFDDIIDVVMRSDLLNEDGIFILEHPRGKEYSNVGHFEQMRRYGGVHFSIFTI